MKSKVILITALLLVALASYSNAQVGLALGNEYGFGLMAQLGSPAARLELGGGLTPLVVYWQTQTIFGGNDDDYLKFYLSGTFGAKLNVALKNPQKKRLGLKFGVSYNTMVKMGFGGGVDYNIALKPKNIVISGGFMYYPNAYDELLNRLNEEEDTDFSKDDVYAALMNFMPFVGLTIYFGK